MYTMRSEWGRGKYFIADQLIDMALNNYNNIFTSGRWLNKDTKDSHILSLLVVDQNLADGSNKSSEKSNTSNRKLTKVDSA